MAKVVGDIAIDLTADVGPLVRELGKGSKAVTAFGKQTEKIGNGLNKFGNATQKLGRQLSVVSGAMAAAGGAAFLLVKNVADSGDKIAKSARAAGMAASDYQELEYALGQVTDITGDEFAKAMTVMQRQMGEAALGTAKTVEAFEAIGISQEDIASGAVTTTQAMEKLMAALDAGLDPAIAAAVSSTLLGRAGQRMAGQLAGAGDEVNALRKQAQDLGLVVGGDTLAQSEKFGDQMDTLQRSMGALKVAIATVLLPVFTEKLLPALQDKVIPALGVMVTKIGDVIGWFQDLPAPIQEAAGVIVTAFAVGGPVILALGVLASTLGALIAATGPIGLFIAAATLMTVAWVKWGDDIKAAVGGAVDWVSDKFNSMLEFVRGIPEQMKEIGANIISGLKDGIAEKWDELKEYMTGLLPDLPNWFRKAFEIESPSKVFHEIGAQIGAGLTNGIAESSADVEAAVAMITGRAKKGADDTAASVLGSMQQMFSKSKPLAAAIALVNTMQGATEALKLPFPANLAAFASVVSTGMGAISAIKGASKGGGGGAPSAAASAPAPNNSPRVALTLNGSDNSTFSMGQVRSLINQINEATEDGAIVRLA